MSLMLPSCLEGGFQGDTDRLLANRKIIAQSQEHRSTFVDKLCVGSAWTGVLVGSAGAQVFEDCNSQASTV